MAGSLASSLNSRTWSVTSVRAPYAFYKLDGDSTDVVAARNGTDTSITYSSGDGKIVQGALFTRASNSKINLPAFNPNTASNPWSAQAWIKTSTTGSGINQYSVISRRTGTNTFQLAMVSDLGSGATNIQLNDWGVTSVFIESGVINDGNWHHIVVTSSSNTSAKIYKDGTLANSTTTMSFITQSIANGNNIGNFDTNGRGWDGDIDEVGFWGVELTSTEVTALYNSGSGLAYPF